MDARRKYGDDLVNQAAALREAGWPIRQIAEKLGMSESAVDWHCIRLGADAPSRQWAAPRAPGPQQMQRGNHVVRRFTSDEDAQLLDLVDQGLPRAEIARRLNRRLNSIQGRLMTLARHEAREEEGL